MGKNQPKLKPYSVAHILKLAKVCKPVKNFVK